MAGSIKVNSAQFGTDATASNNLVLTTPSTPDGSLTISRGNLGATTSDIFYLGPNGNITLQTTGGTITNLSAVNGGQLAGFRNRIINGAMRVSQRQTFGGGLGAVAIAAPGNYTYGGADRFRCSVNAPGGSTLVSAVIGKQTGGASTLGNNGTSQGVQVTMTGGGGSVLISQNIEQANVWDLMSKKVTVSAKVYQDTGTTQNVNIQIGKPPTTANDFTNSPSAIANSSNFSIPSGALTQISATFTLSATDPALGLVATIVFSFTAAITGRYFCATEVQLEEGAVATPFERRPYSVELDLCKRYYETSNFGYTGFVSGTTGGGNVTLAYILGRVAPKYSQPTVSCSAPTTLFTYINGGNINATFASGSGNYDGSFIANLTIPATPAGTPAFITTGNTGWLIFNSELV